MFRRLVEVFKIDYSNRMQTMVIAGGSSDVGCRRSINEDRILLDLELGIFAVTDGMGGERCGSRAADIAISTIHECFNSPLHRVGVAETAAAENSADTKKRMEEAILLANRRVHQEST